MLTLAMNPPYLTAELPGIGGRLKSQPTDFQVEEIAAYEPSGTGDFLYLWVEKQGMGAEYFERYIARQLRISSHDVGTAGLKDRHAITRQWVSVPISVEGQLAQLETPEVRVLRVERHSNKLRSGHLHGNRFTIRLRDVNEAEHAARLQAILDELLHQGVPNYFGPQRFGRDGETGIWGWSLLRGEPLQPSHTGQRPNVRNSFLRKLMLSAGQSVLFNVYLARRLTDGLFRQVLPGDVMAKWPFGGMFTVEDVATEQTRFDARELVTCGPIFGRKTFPTHAIAAEREQSILQESGLNRDVFREHGKLLQGTRRHNLIYLTDLETTWDADGVVLHFTLPPGSYATVVLGEIMKIPVVGDEE